MISLIYSFALFVLVATMVYTPIQRFFYNGNMEQLSEYFNCVEETSPAFRFTMYFVYASVLVWLLSLVIPPLYVVALVLNTVVKGLCWWWLYESFTKGYVQIWLNDLQAAFKKK